MNDVQNGPGRGDDPVAELERQGKRGIPSTTKFVFGALLVFSAASYVLAKGQGLPQLLPVIIAILIVGLLVGLLAGALQRRRLGWLGDVLATALVLMVVVVGGLFISGAFFGTPPQTTILIARLTGVAELLPNPPGKLGPKVISSRQAFTSLYNEMQLPVRAERRIDLAIALKKKPDLDLDGGSIFLDGPQNTRTLSVGKLSFNNGMIVTNGHNLTIEADEITSNGGQILSFPEGMTSNIGRGRDGGSVVLRLAGNIIGHLDVILRGENGAPGAPGAPGANGGRGAGGENASSSLFDCNHGPGAGGQGQPGGRGGNGSAGGGGGNGGALTIVAVDPNDVAKSITLENAGGSPGKGGAGGPGGNGGDGGPGGSSNGNCHGTGPTGASGPPGPPGEAGPDGPQSRPGPPLITRIITS